MSSLLNHLKRAAFICAVTIIFFSISSAQEICNNGIDDDNDTFIDCDDSDCQGIENIFPIVENFDGGTFDNPEWVLTGSAYINTGWLTLTDDLPAQAGSAFLDTQFVSTSNIIIEFDYATVNYNGDNCTFGIGDGLAFYLTDGTAGPSIGEPGAALGYSHGVTGDPTRGIDGGFIGIGLDEFGSFYGTNAGPSTCPETGEDAITIRGEETNDNITAYRCLGTTLLPGNADVDVLSRSEARRVRMLLSPGGILDMYMDLNDGNGLQPIFLNLATGQVAPPTFKLGFSSSTGGACIAHEIDNVVVAKPADIEVNIEAPDTVDVCDGSVRYTITAINHGPNDVSQIYLQNQLPPGVSPEEWLCDGCIETAGFGVSFHNNEVNMDVGDTVVLTVFALVDESAVGTTVVDVAGIDFGCTDFISSDINSSMAQASIVVTQTAISIDLGTDTALCSFPLTINATTTDATYGWQDGSTDSTLQVSTGGIFWVDVTTGTCIERDSIMITDNSVSFDLGGDRNLCSGLVNLDATTSGANYMWQDGSSDAIYNVSDAGIYWVDVMVANCSLRDSVLVEDGSFSVDLGRDSSLCNNAITLDASNNNATYLWQDGSGNATLVVTSSGNYWVEVMIGNCVNGDTVMISDNSFTVSLGEDRSVCESTVILDATVSGGQYLWQDSSTTSTLTASTDGNYSVEVRKNNCTANASVELSFIECLDCEYHAPGAFTPNGDGFNDFFSVFFDCELTAYEIEIFNRWGESVFRSDDPLNPWDGHHKGEIAPSDMFVWKIWYSDQLVQNALITGLVLLQR